MQYSYAGLALVALAAAKPVPQSDSSCVSSYDGPFAIQVVQPTVGTKAKRQSGDDDLTLMITLQDGILKDQNGRQGEIVANGQFQFDDPLQDGALAVDGFSICGGSFLAHDNGVTTWDSCKSGDFSNLYASNSASYCKVVNIQIIGSSASVSAAPSSAPSTSAAATQISDGQPQAPTSIAAPVTQITDGQPQAPTSIAAPVTQISDGQPQAPTSIAAPVTQISDGQPQAPLPTGGYPNGTVVPAAPTPSVVPATGAASSFTIGSSVVGLVAAIAALAMF